MKASLVILLATAAFGQAPLFQETFAHPQPDGVPQGWQFWAPRPAMTRLSPAAQAVMPVGL